MFKKIAAVAVLALLLGYGIFQAIQTNGKDNNQAVGVAIGDAAPNFTLETTDGKTVSLSDYKGKKVFLNFWATWCPPCEAEMPEMQIFHEKYAEDVVILAVNVDPAYDVKGFMDARSLTFPALLDMDGGVTRTYEVLTIPTSYFLDEKGIIQHKQVGAMSLDMMESTIKKF